MFVSLEGLDGVGKSTQARLLAERLRAAGHEVVECREPGGTPLGDQLRTVVLARDGGVIEPRTDALLFNAARAQLVGEVINPALATGMTVVCARFADSTLAYQGYGAGVPLDELRVLAGIATQGLVPDLTLLLDIDPAIGLARKADADRTRFEHDFDADFHARVRAGFLELAKGEPSRFRVIDASRDIDAVFADVLEAAGSEA